MAKRKIKLISYGETMYSLLINDMKGKYFQNINAPHLIAMIPKENNPYIHYVEKNRLSVWFPLSERNGEISLGEFAQYALITDEQFEEYKTRKTNLSEVLLAHKDSPAFKESKTNLTENKQ